MSNCKCNENASLPQYLDGVTIVGAEFTYMGKGYRVLTSEDGAEALQRMIDKLNAEKKEENKPAPKQTGFERRKSGETYYIANDGFPFAEDDDKEFDDVNYKNGNYFGTKALADNMSRALNLTAKLIRFAAEHNGVGGIMDSYEIDLIGGSLVALKSSGAPAFTPLFGSKYITEMAIEGFREDLMWYFNEFLPAMKENKYV